MKRALYAVRRTVYLLTICVVLLALKPVLRAIYYPTHYKIYSNSYLSNEAIKLVQDGCVGLQQLPSSKLIQELKKSLPWIERVRMSTHFNGDALLQITPYEPVCVINNRYISLSNGVMVDTPTVIASLPALLPHIHLNSADDADHICSIHAYVKDFLTPFAAEHCAIKWHAPTAVEYIPAEANFTLIAHDKQLVDYQLLAECSKAAEAFKKGTKVKNLMGGDLLVDVRFAQQIIVSMKERGSNEGRTNR